MLKGWILIIHGNSEKRPTQVFLDDEMELSKRGYNPVTGTYSDPNPDADITGYTPFLQAIENTASICIFETVLFINFENVESVSKASILDFLFYGLGNKPVRNNLLKLYLPRNRNDLLILSTVVNSKIAPDKNGS